MRVCFQRGSGILDLGENQKYLSKIEGRCE